MARPIKSRRICQMPHTLAFSPSVESADAVELAVEEYEAIRLIDYLGFTQEGCAMQMNVARTTVQAMYDAARKKLADVLVNGKRLTIHGGSYAVCPRAAKCCGKDCGERNCKEKCCADGEALCVDCPK